MSLYHAIGYFLGGCKRQDNNKQVMKMSKKFSSLLLFQLNS